MNIGAAAQASGVSQRMIRHYEAIGLVAKAARRQSGYRDYGDNEIHALRFIRRARDLGFPIEEIRELLALWHDRGRASADVKRLALSRVATLNTKEREIRAMRRALEQLARSCHGDERADCPILDDLAGNGA